MKQETEPPVAWLKTNLFNIINLVLLLVGLAYNYGNLNSKIVTLEVNGAKTAEQVNDIELHGTAARPAYEARLVALEKKTDDLAVLKQIVQTQSDNISKLSEIVRADHDVLVRMSMQKP